ncbi:hypothetical protein [Sphingomonas sp. LT1P40]|uniref:hypothetical protein n=1 Tax=Alteristakelama amylovorans TaxID=3096166 RepID=UPI002FCC6873
MDISTQGQRYAFSQWIRTGLWPGDPDANDVEVKFNPYHDPRNGQFTFAPGGPRSLSRVTISHRRRGTQRAAGSAIQSVRSETQPALVTPSNHVQSAPLFDAVYRTDEPAQLEQVSRGWRPNRGSNSLAFQDPMTLEQVFPGLRNSPGGAVVAVADNIFDLSGPSRAANAAIVQNWSNVLIEQIRATEPGYRYDSFGFPQTFQGQMNQLNHLRWTRAAALVRAKAELRPLQVETLRFIQERADRAYSEGVSLLRAGKLPIRLSPQEALGNYIDQRVRHDLRKLYKLHGVEAAGRGLVRVNRRENDSSGSELTYRLPDARVGSIAFDVTLTPKNLKTPQVQGFFGTDFRPTHVIIIRPRQVGADHTYVITRPERK